MNDRAKQEEKAVRRGHLRASLWAVVASMATSSFLPGTLRADWPLGPLAPAPHIQKTADQPPLPPLPVGIRQLHQVRLVSGTTPSSTASQETSSPPPLASGGSAPQLVLRPLLPQNADGVNEVARSEQRVILPPSELTEKKQRFHLSDISAPAVPPFAVVQAPEAGFDKPKNRTATENDGAEKRLAVAELLRIPPRGPLRVSDRCEPSQPLVPMIEAAPVELQMLEDNETAAEVVISTAEEVAEVVSEGATDPISTVQEVPELEIAEAAEHESHSGSELPAEEVVLESVPAETFEASANLTEEKANLPASESSAEKIVAEESIAFEKVVSVPVPEAVRTQLAVPAPSVEGEAERARLYQPRKPLVIDMTTRSAQSATPSAAPAAVPDPSAAEPAEELFQGPACKIMTAIKGEATSIQPNQVIRRVSMQDQDICDVVLVGPYKLLLIGRQEGVTRLAIWSGEASLPEIREIHVVLGQPQAIGASMDAVAERLTATITATFPGSQVRVTPSGDGLAVTGRAVDSRSARAIIRLVRTACLKTVSDQLEVR